MDASEFSRTYDLRSLPPDPVELVASPAEREALADRFALVGIDTLIARLTLVSEGDRIRANGRLDARITQSCAISGESLPAIIDEPVQLVFVPAGDVAGGGEDEVELDEAELDEIEYRGTSFDLGEAIAQSLALAIDPYAVGPEAEAVRREQGLLDADRRGALAAGLEALRPRGGD